MLAWRSLGMAALLFAAVVLPSGCRPSAVGQEMLHRLVRSGDLDLCHEGQPASMVAGLDKEALRYLPQGLLSEKLPPLLWQRCAERLLEGLDPERAKTLIDHMGWTYRRLLHDEGPLQDRVKQEQLVALLEVYATRPVGLDGRAVVMQGLLGDLRRALAERRLSPPAQKEAEKLMSVLELQQGRWQGQPVGEATIQALREQGDKEHLRWFARRLPTPELRRLALRAVVQMAIDGSGLLSDWPQLAGRRQQIEEALLREGRYPVPLHVFHPQRAWLSLQQDPIAQVEQHVAERRAMLVVLEPGGSALGQLSLRPLFQLELAGLSHPVGLCPPPRPMTVDPEPVPCLLPGEISVDHPLVSLSPSGVLSFARQMSMEQAVALARQAEEFLVPFSVAGQVVLVTAWPLRFRVLPPSRLVFTPRDPLPGARGPDLHVLVDNRIAHRLVFTVNTPRPYYAVLEVDDPGDFAIVSSGNTGAPGLPGAPGHAGRSGRDGYRALCTRKSPGQSGQSGEEGEPGGPGGPGASGGPGGDVLLDVSCGGHDCQNLRELLRGLARSEGGEGGTGGPGGQGGPGGPGGRGGIGVICHQVTDACTKGSDGLLACGDETSAAVYTLPAGPTGPQGRTGRLGPDGPPGPRGPAGRVEIRFFQ